MGGEGQGGPAAEGRIVAVHGDVIDVEFREGLPSINDALEVRDVLAGVEITEEVLEILSSSGFCRR